jgi:hypothetical protein
MNNTDYNEELYNKMSDAQAKYKEWLLSQPPAEILNHTYEFTVREDIVMEMEELNLSPKQAKALLKSSDPLSDVFKDFSKRETDHMDNIRDTIESRANDVIRENLKRNQRDSR